MPARFFLLLLLFHSAASAATWHVDNRNGNDQNDGSTPQTAFATIARAVAHAQTSDTISLVNTGTPYGEPILLQKLGGTPRQPFLIEGNGAVLTGLKKIAPDQWEKAGEDLYFYPLGKAPYGMPYLASAGKKLPEAGAAGSLEPGQFFWDRERGIHFRCEPGRDLTSYDLGATLTISGFSLSGGSSNIICRNLVCEYFANDGFNMHGDCRGIYLENVVARHNGDDGISIHESGGLVVRNAHVHHNTYGLQDVNAARSVYNGVLSEHNLIGASFHGGFYSLVDCRIRDNREYQIDLVADPAKHLIGSEFNPFCQTTLFAGNIVVSGKGCLAGLHVGNGARAVVEHSVFTGMEAGIRVEAEGFCHLTTSAIVDCAAPLVSRSPDFFRDYNVYQPARMNWLDVEYGPEKWDEFRAAASHDENSRVGPVDVAEDGTVAFPEGAPVNGMGKKVGPSAPIAPDFGVPVDAASG